jgi:hypothetical protein
MKNTKLYHFKQILFLVYINILKICTSFRLVLVTVPRKKRQWKLQWAKLHDFAPPHQVKLVLIVLGGEMFCSQVYLYHQNYIR